MQFSFSYDKKKVIQALRYHFLARAEIRVLIIMVNVFAIFSAALSYFRKVSPLAFLVSSLLWFLLMISLWFILPNAVYKRAATFKDAFKITFGQYGVRIENERGQTEWNWERFSTYLESPHFIHLYFDARSFFLVPKAAAQQSGNLQELRKILEQKITKNK
jgi:signal transduction histidine kinase